MRIVLTGSRELGPRYRDVLTAQFDAFLWPFASSGAQWTVGGAAGLDTSALHWLTDQGCRVRVVVPVRMEDQPPAAQAAVDRALAAGLVDELLELRHDEGIGQAAWSLRDRAMVEWSEMVIGFPVARANDGSGTWATIDLARTTGRAVLVVSPGWPAVDPELDGRNG